MMMMMTMKRMHQRLHLFFFILFFSASFHGGDTTSTTAVHINTHGLLVVSTQITRRRTFVKESSSSVPQWTLVVEEASVKDACDTNNDTSVLYLEEPLFLEDWHCNNTLCVALRNSTFVIPLCDDDRAREEAEGLTRTLVVTLWQQQEESSYRRPLTRRLATLPKMARPQREISPVAKVTLNASLLVDKEHFHAWSKSTTETMREWMPSLLWISICLIFYLRAWRRGSRYDEDRQEQEQMAASRNSIHPLYRCQNHVESSSFVQLAAEASLHQTTPQEEAPCPSHLQQHSQQPNVNPHCTARWSEGNTADQFPDGLASLPFSPNSSRVVVAAMCDADRSCTESVVRDSDMYYPNNEQEETEMMMGDSTSSANKPEIGDCKKSMEELPLLDHHHQHHHRVLKDRKESSVQRDVSQHPFLQGETANHHKTQDEVSSKLSRYAGSNDNDANAYVDAEQTPSQPATRKQDSELDGMNQHSLVHGPQDTSFLSDPNTSLSLNGNGTANARELVQLPNHNEKKPTRLFGNSQKDVAVGASNGMCNNSPTGFRNVVDTDTANHLHAHFGGSGATMNQPVETSISGSRTPEERTQPESLSPILLDATSNATSNEHTHLGPCKEPQVPSLSEHDLQSIQEGSQEVDAMEQPNETPLCNESAKSAVENLEAHASRLSWLPASPQHRQTTEVLTQFTEGTLNHLDEAVGSTQILETPLCNESAKSAGANLEAHASRLTWLLASPQHRRTTEVLTQFSKWTLNHLDEAVGSTQIPETPLCNESAKSAGGNLEDHASNLTWLPASPQHRRTTEVITQFSEGTLNHLDEAVGLTQMLETPLCSESAKSAVENLEAHASRLAWLPASPQHRRTTEVLAQFSEGRLNHLDEAVGSTQMLDAFQSPTNPQLDTITMPAKLALASTGTQDEISCLGSYVSTLPPDSDYCSAADEAGTFSPRKTASRKESQPPQIESSSSLVERTQSKIGKAKGPSLEHFPPLTVVLHKGRPKMQKLLSRKRHRGSSDSQVITEKQIIPTPSKKPRPFQNSEIAPTSSKKPRPFKNSKTVPDWVPSNRLQNASKQFVEEGTSWDAIAPTTAASVAKKRPASSRKSFSSEKICK